MSQVVGNRSVYIASSRLLRGAVHFWRLVASKVRVASLKARYPGLQVRNSSIQRGCEIYVATGASLIIRDCHIARGVEILVGANATMIIDADFIGPYSQIVARERIVIGGGSKVAERVTIRDANHDHTVELRMMKFRSAPVHIGGDVWLGANSVVLKGISVGKGATVAAGAVVTRSVDAGEVVGGVPARRISASVRNGEGAL